MITHQFFIETLPRSLFLFLWPATSVADMTVGGQTTDNAVNQFSELYPYKINDLYYIIW